MTKNSLRAPSTNPAAGSNRRQAVPGFDPSTITRPAPILMSYYTIIALLSTVAFPVVFLRFLFRYYTLRFRFDDEGISLSWGLLFRKEVNLTYRRIQDIHVTRNILQRWMGLANVEIQTASGSASAEMTIEGILQPDALRDFLYMKMRGARGDEEPTPHGRPVKDEPLADEALSLLRGIHGELAALRRALESKASEGHHG